MSLRAVVLAGGTGTRLGQVRKAEIRLGGASLLERVAARLPVNKDELLVSTGNGPVGPLPFGTALPDLEGLPGGPLAGIVAAVAHLRQSAPVDTVVLSVAVDTPFLPDDFAPRLLGAIEPNVPAAQAAWRGNAYPTNAAWSMAALLDLPERVADGTAVNSPKALLAQLRAVSIDWGDTYSDDPFANLNTPADLVTLARRANVSSA